MIGNGPPAPVRGLSGGRPRPPARRPPGAHPPGPSRAVFLRRRLAVLAVAGLLVLAVVTVVRLARPGAQLGVTWRLSPASNTVTIRLTRGNGAASRDAQARSDLMVTPEEASGRPARWSRYGRTARVEVRPGP